MTRSTALKSSYQYAIRQNFLSAFPIWPGLERHFFYFHPPHVKIRGLAAADKFHENPLFYTHNLNIFKNLAWQKKKIVLRKLAILKTLLKETV